MKFNVDKILLVLLLVASRVHAAETLQEMNEEFRAFSSELIDFKGALDLYMESDLGTARARTSDFFKGDIERLSKTEMADREQMLSRLKDLYRKMPEVDEKPDLLLKLQYLSFEVISERYIKAQERYDEELKQYQARARSQQPTEVKRDYSPSIAYGQLLVDKYPGFEQVDKSHYLLGYAKSENGDVDGGVSHYMQVVRQHPNSKFYVESNLRAGEYYFDKEMFGQSLPYYEVVKSSGQERYLDKVLYKMAWVYYKLNDYTRAADTFFQLVQNLDMSPTAGSETVKKEAYHFLAAMFAEQGGLPAMQKYFRLRRLPKAEYRLYRMMGDFYADRSDFTLAAEVYRHLITEFPEHPENVAVHQKMISLYATQDKTDGMHQEIERFIRLYESNGRWFRAQRERPDLQALARAAIDSYRYKWVLYQHQLAQKSKKPTDYWKASIAYRDYIRDYPASPNIEDANFRYASTLFFAYKYDWAATEYEYVVNNTKKKDAQMNSALGFVRTSENIVRQKRSYKRSPAGGVEPLKDAAGKLLPPQDLIPEERGMVASMESMLKLDLPPDAKALFLYKIAEIYFRNNLFDHSRPLFARVVEEHASNRLAIEAARNNLESYRLENNWNQVEFWSKKLLALSGPDRKLAGDVSKLLSSSMFKRAEELAAQGKTDEAINEYHRLAKEQPQSDHAPKALYNASVLADQSGKSELALKDLTRISRQYGKHELAGEAKYRQGLIQDSLFNVTEAKRAFTELLQQHPRHPQAREAKYRLALIAQAEGRQADAGRIFEDYALTHPNAEEKRKALVDSIDALTRAKRTDEAYRVKQTYMRTYPRDIEKQIVFKGQRYSEVMKRNPREAAGLKNQVDTLIRKHPTLDLSLEARRTVARMRMDEILPDFVRYRSIRLKLPQEKLARLLQEKTALQESLEKRFTQVIEVGEPENATRALMGIGQTYDLFAQEFYNPPVPPGLSADETELYKAELLKQAYPIEDKAAAAYRRAVENSTQFRLPASISNEAKKRLSRYQPDVSYDPVDWEEPLDLGAIQVSPIPQGNVVPSEGAKP